MHDYIVCRLFMHITHTHTHALETWELLLEPIHSVDTQLLSRFYGHRASVHSKPVRFQWHGVDWKNLKMQFSITQIGFSHFKYNIYRHLSASNKIHQVYQTLTYQKKNYITGPDRLMNFLIFAYNNWRLSQRKPFKTKHINRSVTLDYLPLLAMIISNIISEKKTIKHETMHEIIFNFFWLFTLLCGSPFVEKCNFTLEFFASIFKRK